MNPAAPRPLANQATARAVLARVIDAAPTPWLEQQQLSFPQIVQLILTLLSSPEILIKLDHSSPGAPTIDATELHLGCIEVQPSSLEPEPIGIDGPTAAAELLQAYLLDDSGQVSRRLAQPLLATLPDRETLLAWGVRLASDQEFAQLAALAAAPCAAAEEGSSALSRGQCHMLASRQGALLCTPQAALVTWRDADRAQLRVASERLQAGLQDGLLDALLVRRAQISAAQADAMEAAMNGFRQLTR